MTVRELREKYLAFFESKGHRRFPSGSLVPYDVTGKLDESLLFNGAGMVQFKPYFRGVAQPDHPRLTTVQKCVRTGDIEEVGDATHLTFFEMLGNFSFGDYFRNQAIDYSWEFLTSPEWLGLDPRRLAFTVFETDDEAYDAWSLHLHGAGIDPETRVFRLDEETNYWPAGAFSKGPPGPCGPNSEMFYWVADGEPPHVGQKDSGTASVAPGQIDKRQGSFLPHWTADEATYFVTFRLADSVPAAKREEWKTRREWLQEIEAEGKHRVRESLEYHQAFSDSVDQYLDAGHGSCLLRDPRAAEIVRNALRHFDGDRYNLVAYAVMPNHVHAVVKPRAGQELRQVLHSWKSFTAHEINRVLGHEGDVWMDESYDHLVRDDQDLKRVVDYTLENPVKAKLQPWPYVGFNDTGTVSDTLDRDGRATYGKEDFLRDDAAGKWVEIWNDVFIQYEWQGHPDASGKGWVKDGMPELPFRSIDTGMGLDRTSFVLAGKQSVYQNGSFDGIFRILSELTGEELDWALDESGKGQAGRIIGDHVRTASFCIADGILPSNGGRGYVLRRLIRRAVLKGQRALGLSEPFLHQTYEGVVETMADAYPELIERRATIVETLRNEEQAFRRTLRAGAERLQGILDRGQTVSGTDAFQLYGTYGFPLEVTQELAAEAGIEVDVEGYEEALRQDQALSRGADGDRSAYGDVKLVEEQAVENAPGTTAFTGYDCVTGTGRVVRVRPQGDVVLIALDETPFYAASGGQIGDTGTLTLGNGTVLNVEDTTKEAGVFWHRVNGATPDLLGQTVTAQVDAERRRRIQRNHTATHLLHAALRETLGTHVAQAGSYVGPDRLRFDFAHGKAMTPEEIETVERRVNERILSNEDVITYVDLPIAEARQRGAMALFGEKYGDRVRMVEVGDFSRELCGGIHVRTAAEIGQFRIVSESSAASGIRRIEAVTGETAYEMAREEAHRLREAASLLKASPSEIVQAVEKALEQARQEKKKREELERSGSGASSGGGQEQEILAKLTTLGGFQSNQMVSVGHRDHRVDALAQIGDTKLFIEIKVGGTERIAMERIDTLAAAYPDSVSLLAFLAEGGALKFTAKVGAEALAKGAHAGNLLREVAKVAGGGGGGRAEFATAGGKDPSKVAEALATAETVLQGQIQK